MCTLQYDLLEGEKKKWICANVGNYIKKKREKEKKGAGANKSCLLLKSVLNTKKKNSMEF